jgi:hypothetical protein
MRIAESSFSSTCESSMKVRTDIVNNVTIFFFVVKKNSELPAGWTTESWSHEVPQQDNGSDCGVFTCKFGDYLSRGFTKFNFEAKNMQTMRKAILIEIANKKMLF